MLHQKDFLYFFKSKNIFLVLNGFAKHAFKAIKRPFSFSVSSKATVGFPSDRNK